jgi:capsular exopolysaccharide synthesis family protein
MAKQTLTQAENKLRAFRESTGTVTADAAASDLVGRVSSLQGESDKVGLDLAQARRRLNTVVGQLGQANATIRSGQARNDSAVQKLQGKLADLQSQKLEAQAKYTDAYAEPLQVINEQLATTQQQLNQELRRVVRGAGGDLGTQLALTGKMIDAQAEVQALGARRQQVQVDLGQAQQRLNQIPGRQLTLASLQRDVDVAESIYSDRLKQAQEVEVGRVMALGNVEVAEKANMPRLPVKPNVPLNLMLGLLLGLGVGLGVALLQDQLDDSVRDQAEASRLAGAPILGTIPMFDRPGTAGMLPGNGGAHGTALEAYRALRYCLDFITPGERGRALLVTSAGPSEGKTTTVLNLAMAVALTGRRVVLIDTDLRRSGLRRMLDVEETRGLTDLLLGEVELPDVLQRNPKTGLMFITSGRQVPNPTELLESKAMRDALEELRGEADLIIFDSPPLLSVADTLVLASLADTVLMVCVAGQSHRYDVQLARQLLSHVGERISGVVLNKVGHKAGYAYHNRYYYY